MSPIVNPDNLEFLPARGRHKDCFLIRDREKLEATLSMIRVQADAGVGFNLEGPGVFVDAFLHIKAMATWNLSKVAVRYTDTGAVDGPSGGYPGPWLNYADFGVEPFNDFEVAYADLCQGKPPRSCGRIVVYDEAPEFPVLGTCEGDALRSVDSINKLYPDGLPVLLKTTSQHPMVKSVIAIFKIQKSHQKSLVALSHANFVCKRECFEFVFREDNGYPLPGIANVRLSLNPEDANTEYSRGIDAYAYPLAFSRVGEVGKQKNAFAYGAGVLEQDLHGLDSPEMIHSHAHQFYAAMSGLPKTVEYIALFLPPKCEPFHVIARRQAENILKHHAMTDE